jgi:hypothetical protein
MAFENFVKFYRENRDRFELASRKKWDEVTSSLTPPHDFYWMSDRQDGYDVTTIGWTTRGGHYQYQFPLYELHYHKWTGKNIFTAMAELGDKLDELDESLGDALLVLTEFKEDLEDMTLWYNVDINTGKLVYLKAVRLNGLLQVKASLKEE